MKRLFKAGFLLAVALVLTVSAMAADKLGAGFYDIGSNSNVTIEPQTKNGTPVSGTVATKEGSTANVTYYAGAEKLYVKYTGEADAGDQFLVLLATGSQLPDKDQAICYINQTALENGVVEFTVYPTIPAGTTELSLFITSSRTDFTTPIRIPVKYSAGGEYEQVPYVLGDVNEDGDINVKDAVQALRISAEMYDYTQAEKKAADVTRDNAVTIHDAVGILRYSAELITSWDQV